MGIYFPGTTNNQLLIIRCTDTQIDKPLADKIT